MGRDRAIVLSRRSALALAAATLGCGPKPVMCLSPPCLEPEPAPCPPAVRFIAFSGPATSLDATASARLDELAQAILAGGLRVTLAARIYDDGHAESAMGLNEPRLAAVEQGLAQRGVQTAWLTRITPEPRMPPAEWQQLTNDGNPLTQSGLVEIACAQ